MVRFICSCLYLLVQLSNVTTNMKTVTGHSTGLKQRGNLQSSQVDLSPKSGIFDGVAVYYDAKGVTFLGGFGGMLPQKILKN